MRYLGLIFGLIAANFLYQTFGDMNWPLAVDRSWFQVAAVLAAWLTAALPSTPREAPHE